MLDEKTILVVEDEDSLRGLYTEMLEEEGATVRSAANGKEALGEWTEDVDAVLLDRRLPEMYGGEVLYQKRAEGKQTPVAILTAVEPDLDMADMEFDEYALKPINKDKILNIVSELFDTDKINEEVREFIRVGLKLEKLQEKHDESMLQTHAEYKQLVRKYNEVQQQITERKDSLTDQETKALTQAKKEI